MIRYALNSESDWIFEGLSPLGRGSIRVENFIPSSMDQSWRVFHPATSWKGSLTWRQVAERNSREFHSQAQWMRIREPAAPFSGVPYDEVFDPPTGSAGSDFLLAVISSLEDGEIGGDQYFALVSTLGSPLIEGATGKVNWYEEPFELPDSGIEGRPFSVPVSSVVARKVLDRCDVALLADYDDLKVMSDANVQFSYIWPQNHSWVIFSDYDLDSSLVGLKSGVCKGWISKCEDIFLSLEALPIGRSERVDLYGDTLNVN